MGCADDPGCRDTLDQLYEYLDGELDAGHLAGVKEHLAHCNSCLQQYGFEQEVRTMVARSCCCHAPEQLRQRIITRITEIRLSGGMGQASITMSMREFEA